MLNNVGGEIKSMAKAMMVIGIVSSIIVGILIICLLKEYGFVLGIVVVFIGSLLLVNASILTYALGQVTDNTDILANRLTPDNKGNPGLAKAKNENPIPKNTPKNAGKCELCGKENTEVFSVNIVDDMGVRYRKVCQECFNDNNCELTK